MAHKVLDYRPAQNKAGSPSIVQVERPAGGGVVVRVAYPAGTFREAMIGVVVTCGAFGLFPVLFVWYSGWPVPGWGALPFLPWMLFVGLVAWILIGRVLRLAQSYTLQVDRDGITIQRFRGRREWFERLPRERITNVRIGFGQAGRRGRSTAWLIIALVKPWYRMNRTLLHGLGGDQLARVADAVREGLGLEPVEWPSGRPRKASSAGAAGSNRAAPNDREWVAYLLFGVMFLLAGSFFVVNGSRNAWQIRDRLHGLRQTTCVLLDKRVTAGIGEHLWLVRHSSGHYQAWTRVRYEDGGVSRTVEGDLFPTNATENGKAPSDVVYYMTVGKNYPLWIDSRDPSRVYLSRGDETPWSYSFMIGASAILAVAGLACFAGGIVTRPRRAGRQRHNHALQRTGRA